MKVRESGSDLYTNTATFAGGEVLRVAREGGDIVYYIDGVEKHRVAENGPEAGEPLMVDFTLNNLDGVIYKLRMSNTRTGAHILSIADYYPFGSLVPQRRYNPTEYRYGFQGQEKDDELRGVGNSINYKYRVHDPRIGRFLSLDPLFKDFPHNSPYAFSENRLLDKIELEGLEAWDLPSRSPDTREKAELQMQAAKEISEAVIVSVESTVSILSQLPVGLRRLEGSMVGSWDNYGEMEGEKGLKSYSEGLNNTGTLLSFTPLAPAGRLLMVGSDLIDTGLDFKNKDPETAVVNTAVRVTSFAIGTAADKGTQNAAKDVQAGVFLLLENLENTAIEQNEAPSEVETDESQKLIQD